MRALNRAVTPFVALGLIFIVLAFVALSFQPAAAQQPAVNLALNRPVIISSQTSPHLAANAVDGSIASRWSSNYSDPQFLYVDLGAPFTVSRVLITWEDAYAKNYSIDTSLDSITWQTIFTNTGNSVLINDLNLSPVSARYVRMTGLKRATGYGYSIKEFEIYGAPPATFVFNEPPCVTLNPLNLVSNLTFTTATVMYWCDLPDRIHRVSYDWDLTKPRKQYDGFTTGTPTEADVRNFLRQSIDHDCEDAGCTSRIAALDASKGLKVNVALNGSTLTRPVFLKKTDGTLGAKTTTTVPVGSTPCDRRDRIVTLVNGVKVATSYFRLATSPFADKTINGYAVCTVIGPVVK